MLSTHLLLCLAWVEGAELLFGEELSLDELDCLVDFLAELDCLVDFLAELDCRVDILAELHCLVDPG